MNCDQHCLLVNVDEYGEAVEVFMPNMAEEKWEKIDSIGKHMIYISGTTCFCIEAKVPIMENKIFFPRLHTKNRRVVFYSLDTCRYHTFDAQEHLEDFYGTMHHLSLNFWIEPSWS
nr:F-box protein At4g00893-like [Tanacetum cinerariifolium]